MSVLISFLNLLLYIAFFLFSIGRPCVSREKTRHPR